MCLEQMGPVAAKRYPGQQWVRAEPASEPSCPAERAQQELD
jgi:hypothetical protein